MRQQEPLSQPISVTLQIRDFEEQHSRWIDNPQTFDGSDVLEEDEFRGGDVFGLPWGEPRRGLFVGLCVVGSP